MMAQMRVWPQAHRQQSRTLAQATALWRVWAHALGRAAVEVWGLWQTHHPMVWLILYQAS